MAATTGTAGSDLDPKYDDFDFPIVAPVKVNGHPGHLTPEQNAAVKQLRESLEKQGYTDRLDSLTLVCVSSYTLSGGHGNEPRLILCPSSCGSCAHGSSTSLPPRRCEPLYPVNLSPTAPRRENGLLTCCRFVDAEKWRKDTKLDELLPTWEYPEKEQIFQYYPQYYHGTDNVRCCPCPSLLPPVFLRPRTPYYAV